MTSFWSAWIIVLTVSCLVLIVALLVWNMRNYAHVEEGESMGHEFDGIVELNNPLPKWWTYLFWFTIIWAVFYLAAYPGLGNWKGFLGWQSAIKDIQSLDQEKQLRQQAKAQNLLIQYDREVEHAEQRFGKVFDELMKKDILTLAKDPEAVKIGQRLFLQNCAQCHGADARGGKGFPNLTDKDWLYGGEPDAIKQTILYGRQATMPAWKDALGEQGLKEVTAYVLSLSGRKVNQQLAQAGKARFAMCSACHGMDGQGSLANNLPMGAPNLTDNIWLYGGSKKAVMESIANGRNGVMPAWKDILGEEKVHVLTAYVYRISHPEIGAETAE